MADIEEQVELVIEDYIKRKRGTVTMREVHKKFTGENEDFTRFNQAVDMYKRMDWDEDKFQEFLNITRDTVEGGIERISECYFTIGRPRDLTVERIDSELGAFKYEDDDSDDDPDGFDYEIRDDGVVRGSYIATTIKTNISPTGQIEELVSENAVPFRIKPEENLVIVESTYPPDVQRMKGALGRTSFKFKVTSNLEAHFEEANEKLEEFRSSFKQAEEVKEGGKNE